MQPKDEEEWLNLYLGKKSFSISRDNESESPETVTPSKVFSCRYCLRKFYSSQALGGHQNAHKRERSAIRSYPMGMGMMAMMNLPFHNSMMIRSLGVQAHSQVHKPGRDRESAVVVAKFEGKNMPLMALRSLPEETPIWPGSFRLNTPAPPAPAPPPVLDLNLKL